MRNLLVLSLSLALSALLTGCPATTKLRPTVVHEDTQGEVQRSGDGVDKAEQRAEEAGRTERREQRQMDKQEKAAEPRKVP